MLKISNLIFCFLLVFSMAAEAGENSWGKPFGSSFKSAENYSPLNRTQRWESEQRGRQQQQSNLGSLQQLYRNQNAALIKEYSAQQQVRIPEKIPALPSPIKNVRFETKNASVENKRVEGKWHSIKSIDRLDKAGGFIRRDLVDRVRLDKKTTLTVTKSYSPEGKLIQLVEKFKIKVRGGVQVQKFVSTQFDPAGNPLNRMLAQNEFKRTGFFNSFFGKLLGIALVTAAAVFAPAALSAVAAGIAQFGVSLAQGQGFKNALVAAGISFAATAVGGIFGLRLSAFLGKLPGVGNALNVLNATLSAVGRNFAGAFGATAARSGGSNLLQKFALQVSLRAGSELFSQSFGKKLGVFATVATLAVAGMLATSAISNAVGAPLSPAQFSRHFANSVFSGALQGGIAETLKNRRGLGAQFLNQLASSIAGETHLSAVAEQFQALGRAAQKIFQVYWNHYLAPFSQVRQILSKTAVAKINDRFTGYQWELKAGNFDPSQGINVFMHGWNTGSDANKIVTWGLVPQERFAAVGDKRSAVVVLWDSGEWNSIQSGEVNVFKHGIENANRATPPLHQLLNEIYADVKRANPGATVNVIGHSLAARAILGAAVRAAERHEQIADHVALFSPAVENTAFNPELWTPKGDFAEGEFYPAHRAVKTITNVFSKDDSVLSPALFQGFSPGRTAPALGKYGAADHGFFLPENVKELNATGAVYRHSSYSRSDFNQVRFIYEELFKQFEAH